MARGPRRPDRDSARACAADAHARALSLSGRRGPRAIRHGGTIPATAARRVGVRIPERAFRVCVFRSAFRVAGLRVGGGPALRCGVRHLTRRLAAEAVVRARRRDVPDDRDTRVALARAPSGPDGRRHVKSAPWHWIAAAGIALVLIGHDPARLWAPFGP